MSTAAHREIAAERFLELMAQSPEANPGQMAALAIEHADAFEAEYAARAPQPKLMKKVKGCKACFGSGGKANEPCKVCAGTGKVAA